jgi:hypothetical protein
MGGTPAARAGTMGPAVIVTPPCISLRTGAPSASASVPPSLAVGGGGSGGGGSGAAVVMPSPQPPAPPAPIRLSDALGRRAPQAEYAVEGEVVAGAGNEDDAEQEAEENPGVASAAAKRRTNVRVKSPGVLVYAYAYAYAYIHAYVYVHVDVNGWTICSSTFSAVASSPRAPRCLLSSHNDSMCPPCHSKTPPHLSRVEEAALVLPAAAAAAAKAVAAIPSPAEVEYAVAGSTGSRRGRPKGSTKVAIAARKKVRRCWFGFPCHVGAAQ